MSHTKTALVTGAGRNIGRAVALALAREGFSVIVNGSTDRAAAESVANEVRALGAKAMVAMGDVGLRDECTRIVAAAVAEFGRVDVLVNNAALRPLNAFLDLTEADYRRVMAVDLEAAIWLSQACLPGMLAQGWGRIVNFTGMNAIHGYAGRAPVSIAKHAVWGLTKSLGKEFGPRGVTVNAISPGPIAADDETDAPSAYRQAMVARVPVGRMGQPAEVAALVRLLASAEGAFINGQMLAVNGGAET
ncbi:SDR family oxidoreductase [Sediminicoccus sp. KRV36]|uniref:SDR family NAD(P)-dependent oxidoreductase n=1 Tax=Sediminicoccus sp. KRV36 TaxID=3133721 RepID=UPI00200D136D|nr:SDR family oxidoreductase [Sediminicoccus rosea]UPY38067.1 SDR family oxidoreductase [Sediminicoccus rosea]